MFWRGKGTRVAPNGVGTNIEGLHMVRAVGFRVSGNGKMSVIPSLDARLVISKDRKISPAASKSSKVSRVPCNDRSSTFSLPSERSGEPLPYTHAAPLPTHREQGFLKSHFTLPLRQRWQAFGRTGRLSVVARRRQYCSWRTCEISERICQPPTWERRVKAQSLTLIGRLSAHGAKI